MKFSSGWALPAFTALFALAQAQTQTDCNPMNTTCPPDIALGVSNYTIDLQNNLMSDKVWNWTAGSAVYGNNGAEFTINSRGDAPTVKSNFHIFFGQVEVIMKAASGQGIVSSIVLLSDDLDEVDWELIGGNDSYVQTNYFGKGNSTSYDRAAWFPVSQAQEQWHNYTVDWSPEKLDWYIDGQIVRTLLYADALDGYNYPQTPCDVRLGIWAGGDPKNPNGTIEWAGGLTDYSKAPFTMTVKSIRVSDAHNATEYVWGDRSGSMASIEVKDDTPALKLDGNNSGSAAQTAAQKWRSLSSGAKIAIFASVFGALAIFAGIFIFCCIKQRRIGKHERMIEDAKFEKERAELMAYRAEMGRQRSEKMATAQAYSVSPMMGNAGASFMPVKGGMRNPSGPSVKSGYAQSGYAQSVSSSGSGRGYQKY